MSPFVSYDKIQGYDNIMWYQVIVELRLRDSFQVMQSETIS